MFVDNLTKKTTAVALVNANGSFSTLIAAGITDKLRVRIIDESGNETVQELAEFKQVNADGSVSQVVGEAGGIVEGPAWHAGLDQARHVPRRRGRDARARCRRARSRSR